MSEEEKSSSISEGRSDKQETSQPVEPVMAKQPRDESPQEEPLVESEDDIPSQEEEDEGIPAVEGEESELEDDFLEVERPKTGRERGDGPDVKGKRLPIIDYTKRPEAGEGP